MSAKNVLTRRPQAEACKVLNLSRTEDHEHSAPRKTQTIVSNDLKDFSTIQMDPKGLKINRIQKALLSDTDSRISGSPPKIHPSTLPA